MEKSRSQSSGYAQEQRRRYEREQLRKREQEAAAGPERRAELDVERGEIYDQDDRSQAHAMSQQQAAHVAGQAALRGVARQQAQPRQP